MLMQNSGRSYDIASALCLQISHFLTYHSWSNEGEFENFFIWEADRFIKKLKKCKIVDRWLWTDLEVYVLTSDGSKLEHISNINISNIEELFESPYEFYDEFFTAILNFVPTEKEFTSDENEMWLTVKNS